MRDTKFEILKKASLTVVFVFFSWAFLSVFASAIKADQKGCGKEYPIGYFLHTNLFCEVEEKAP